MRCTWITLVILLLFGSFFCKDIPNNNYIEVFGEKNRLFKVFKRNGSFSDLKLISRSNWIGGLLGDEVLKCELGILLGILSWAYFYVLIVYLYKSWAYFLPWFFGMFWV